MFDFLQRIASAVVSTDYHGPAKVETFGRDTHIGWVRSTAERIDILTVKGEALKLDARARFRLTPLTWQELVDAALYEKERREGWRQAMLSDTARREDERDALKGRVEDLRKAMAKVRDELADETKLKRIQALVDDLNETLAADERAAEEDGIPF